jgi:hypothetical protein
MVFVMTENVFANQDLQALTAHSRSRHVLMASCNASELALSACRSRRGNKKLKINVNIRPMVDEEATLMELATKGHNTNAIVQL